MLVDYCLDLLWVDLQPADVDDAAAASHEIAAVSAQVDHVSSVDVTLRVEERLTLLAEVADRRPPRPDAQCVVLDFEIDSIHALCEIRKRETRAPVRHLECYSRFRRCERMPEA